MSMPTVENASKNVDSQLPQKCLQLVQKILETIPETYSKDQLKLLCNLVHFPHQGVKEEMGSVLLSMSSDSMDLLEV